MKRRILEKQSCWLPLPNIRARFTVLDDPKLNPLQYITDDELFCLGVGATEAYDLLTLKIKYPGLAELNLSSTKKDVFFATLVGNCSPIKDDWHKEEIKAALNQDDFIQFSRRIGKLGSRKPIELPFEEMLLITFWTRPTEASAFENLCFWSDEALTHYFNLQLHRQKWSGESFRKMRQRLKLKKASVTVIKGIEKNATGFRLIFKAGT